MKTIKFSKRWRVFGEFPTIDPSKQKLTEDMLHGLTQDLWQARLFKKHDDDKLPDPELMIDIGWYPEADAKGQYRGRFYVDFEREQDEIRTRSLKRLREWVIGKLRNSKD